MNQEKLIKEFTSLPPEAQRQVADFISFLQVRYKRQAPPKTVSEQRISEHPFIGMWEDRADMKDSTAWVRNIRQSEWRND